MHRKRPEIAKRFPVHVTMKIAKGVRNLRRLPSLNVIERALLGAKGRFGLRITQFTVQRNHLHLLVETTDKAALRCAMTGLNVRIARGLNKLMGRQGQVIEHRYHAHILRTPAEVRNAISYIRGNLQHHSGRSVRDAYSSDARPDLVVAPRTWLLTVGPSVRRARDGC